MNLKKLTLEELEELFYEVKDEIQKRKEKKFFFFSTPKCYYPKHGPAYVARLYFEPKCPSGISTAIPVGTAFHSPGFKTTSSTEYKSKPASPSLLRTGNSASGRSFLTFNSIKKFNYFIGLQREVENGKTK
jgi:hypothetical protein